MSDIAPTPSSEPVTPNRDINGVVDTDSEDYTPPEEGSPQWRRANNIREYHRQEAINAQRIVDENLAIVARQDEILGNVTENDTDTDDVGFDTESDTNIAERFQQQRGRYLNVFDSMYTVEELREELREYGLPVDGNKPDLIERLVAYHNDELDENGDPIDTTTDTTTDDDTNTDETPVNGLDGPDTNPLTDPDGS